MLDLEKTHSLNQPYKREKHRNELIILSSKRQRIQDLNTHYGNNWPKLAFVQTKKCVLSFKNVV